ncbi:Indoleamine 2,3-dioxygenase [Hysterangium stoloniferum]|nr:Indoleamine 2,3-dioxygenase [Hysterangium stoloniferum]
MQHTLPPDHFLSLPRPDVNHLGSVPDTSTLAAHDFDIDVRTGFMPPQPPPARLPCNYAVWEQLLEDATSRRLKLGERTDLTEQDRADSEEWREKVRYMPTLPTDELAVSEATLRRAHHVLTYILHFYVHSLPQAPDGTPIHIPAPLSIPLLQVSAHIVLPPILTYSDNVLYNWDMSPPPSPSIFSIDPLHLHSQSTFTGTSDEEHFYLTSSRIELVGAKALTLLRSIEDEAFVNDLLSLRRISNYLTQLAGVIDCMTGVLNEVKNGCDPTVFYTQIRPWFRGQDRRPWIYDGVEAAGLKQPTHLLGPSAGQSSIIHVLDIFLGVDQLSRSHSNTTPTEGQYPYLERMQAYMPRHHRAFLNHLKVSQRPLRDIVLAENASATPEEVDIRKALKTAYNESVTALKRFRDAHIRIATLYIISQARRAETLPGETLPGGGTNSFEKGTGGTNLVPFLKGLRDETASAVVGD